MKIINLKKFITSIILVIGIIISIFAMFTNNTFSHNETEYKEITISYGDTLWGIASNEQSNNDYYYKKDIRDIIYDIKRINNLKSSEINPGDKLLLAQY